MEELGQETQAITDQVDSTNLTESPAQEASEAASDRNTGSGQIVNELTDRIAAGEPPTGGDIAVDPEQAKVVGEEAVGGTTPTPGQDIVDNIADSAGVEIPDRQPVQIKEMLDRRDEQRAELDPHATD